ncbi:GntR family transcriptional regulator [Streptomyces pratensis]|uniref:GntR family transcriptional regulator n=1 Tax=Streptomyces pratensis TaxID=1169025 RepID=UPI003019014E
MGSSELLIVLDRDSATPLQQQVCDQVTLLVRSGQLRPGDAVPASRELALQLGVSRTVVLRAYELLRANGILTARRGSGTRVAGTAGATGGAAAEGRSAAPAPLAPRPPRSTEDGDVLWQPWEPAPAHHPGGGIDFRHGTPALADFPVARWLQSLQEAYGRADAAALGYGPAEGAPALRTEIATLVRQSRALDASADRIMVTGGATQAMDILLVEAGDDEDAPLGDGFEHRVVGVGGVVDDVDPGGQRVADAGEPAGMGPDPGAVSVRRTGGDHQLLCGEEQFVGAAVREGVVARREDLDDLSALGPRAVCPAPGCWGGTAASRPTSNSPATSTNRSWCGPPGTTRCWCAAAASTP